MFRPEGYHARTVPARPPNSSPDSGGLALHLRVATAAEHTRIEDLLGLPATIGTVANYTAWMAATRAFQAPLRRHFLTFGDWQHLGLDPPASSSLPALDRDLTRLAAEPAPMPDAPASALPLLPTFAHALGAFYVLEGASLGGRVILRDLQNRLGPAIEGATAFLEGHGPKTGEHWRGVRAALDLFGTRHPDRIGEVVDGARRTFVALGLWLPPRLRSAGITPAGPPRSEWPRNIRLRQGETR